jgi:hypothetical protein
LLCLSMAQVALFTAYVAHYEPKEVMSLIDLIADRSQRRPIPPTPGDQGSPS